MCWLVAIRELKHGDGFFYAIEVLRAEILKLRCNALFLRDGFVEIPFRRIFFMAGRQASKYSSARVCSQSLRLVIPGVLKVFGPLELFA